MPHFSSTNSKKPTVVFIPDTFHTPAYFGALSRYLETEGSDSFTVSLPSIGKRAGEAGMAEDVASIRRVLQELVSMEEDIILVMHGYGAVPCCQAITSLERAHRIREGKQGGLVSLFLIGGLIIPEGENLETMMVALGEKALPEYAADEGPILRPINAATLLFNDLSPSEADHWAFQLEPQSSSVYTTTVKNTCWDSNTPVTYIKCAKDPNVQMSNVMVEKMRKANWTVRIFETGHDPFLSCVEELGDMIVKAGKAGRKSGLLSGKYGS